MSGDETYRQDNASATGRISRMSVDTNVLLQRANDDVGDIDTARSAASVDTDILLGELDSGRDVDIARRRSHETALQPASYVETGASLSCAVLQASFPGTETEALRNSNPAQSTVAPLLSAHGGVFLNSVDLSSSSLSPLPQSSLDGRHRTAGDDALSSPVFGRKSQFHADRLDVGGIDQSLVTARSVASADCAPVDYDDDHTRRDFADFEPRDSATAFGLSGTSEQRRLSDTDDTLCSVTARSETSLDAAMQMRDSNFSPVDADELRLDSGTTSRTVASVDTDVLLQTTDDVVMAMEAARSNRRGPITPRDPTSPSTGNSPLSDFSYADVGKNSHLTKADFVDFENESLDVGETGEIPSRSSAQSKPPLTHRKSRGNSTSKNVLHRGAKEAWGNTSDSNIAGGSRGSSYNLSAAKTVQISNKRDTVTSSKGNTDGRSYTAEFNQRLYNAPLRSRPGTRMYPKGHDSDRSATSSTSLGTQIVAKSRQQSLRPTSAKTKKKSSQHERELSPSGLVLEGVPIRRTGGPSEGTRWSRGAALGGGQSGRSVVLDRVRDGNATWSMLHHEDAPTRSTARDQFGLNVSQTGGKGVVSGWSRAGHFGANSFDDNSLRTGPTKQPNQVYTNNAVTHSLTFVGPVTPTILKYSSI